VLVNDYKQNGFTLIEVLIAFIILSVGLLAIVNLQAMSKTFTHQALQRSLAVSIADSIIERIRVNPSAVLTYTTSGTSGGSTKGAEPTPNCKDATCTSVELAIHDLWEWEQDMDGASSTAGGLNTAGLISPQACFSFAPRAGLLKTGLLTVRIQWTGLNSLSDAVTDANTNCNAASAPNSDSYRRQVAVTTYVIDQGEI